MIFKELFSRYILNAYVLVKVGNHLNSTTILYKYSPYKEHHCGQVSVDIISTSPEAINNKLTNFNQCPLLVGIFNNAKYMIVGLEDDGSYQLDGFEWKILEFLSKYYNFSFNFEYIVDAWGDIDEGRSEGIFTGAMKLVGNDDVLNASIARIIFC